MQEVIHHIKSKEAKQFVRAELEFHLKLAKNKWMSKGLTEADAENKAVEQMGNPIHLGRQLNNLHKPKVDWILIALVVIVMAVSFLPIVALGYTGQIMMNKIIFVLLGAVMVYGMMIMDYRKLEKYGWLFYLVGVLILLMISYFPTAHSGGHLLLKLGPITIESLQAIPFFFLAWASFFNNRKLKVWQLSVLFLLPLYLLLNIPSLSTTFLYLMMGFIMLWWSQLSKKKVLFITIVPLVFSMIAGLFLLSSVKAYQLDRISGFLYPEQYANGSGYMYVRLKELILAGGWFGTAGNKEFIQAAHTDYVFASLTYYYGYLLAALLVLLLSFFLVRMITISTKLNDSYSKLLLIGGITLYGCPFIYNVGMMLGLLPLTSMSLPFISYGLMPTLFNSFLIGIVLSVYRRKDLITSQIG